MICIGSVFILFSFSYYYYIKVFRQVTNNNNNGLFDRDYSIKREISSAVLDLDDMIDENESENSVLLSKASSMRPIPNKLNNNSSINLKEISLDREMNNGIKTSYFHIDDMNGGPLHDAQLKARFQSITEKGVLVNLHTTKGPRPIILSIYDNDIRWQAVKSAKKRYKLHLKDILRIESGKKTTNFMRNVETDENVCFSFVTLKTTLDIEVNSQLDRDCFVLALLWKLSEMRQQS